MGMSFVATTLNVSDDVHAPKEEGTVNPKFSDYKRNVMQDHYVCSELYMGRTYERQTAIGTHIDLRLIDVDEDFWMAYRPSAPIA